MYHWKPVYALEACVRTGSLCTHWKPVYPLEALVQVPGPKKIEFYKSVLELDETCKNVKIVILKFCKGKILEALEQSSLLYTFACTFACSS